MSRGEGYWVIRTYKAGTVGEKIKYWVPGRKPSKSERRIKSDIKQQERNEASAEKRAARSLNANFPGDQGWLLELDYSPEGMAVVEKSVEDGPEDQRMDRMFHAAHHQLRLWLRRVRRACKAAGVELRYALAITSDMDGKTGEVVRLHHHAVINLEAAEIALEQWTLGGTDRERLYDEVDHTGLAAYLLDQVRRLPDEKKYISSRNLIIPQPKDRVAVNEAELAVPRGGQLLYRAGYRPGMPQYIRYILPEVGKIRAGKDKHSKKAGFARRT